MAISNQPKELVVRLRFRSDVGQIPAAVGQIMGIGPGPRIREDSQAPT